MKIIDSINNASQRFAVRLYTRGMGRSDRQRGISALEYIILAVLIVLVVASAATLLGPKIKAAFSHVSSNITT